ncbi:MAG: geranylgeranylglycerol-phosphate geranylgeranyltransferase [Saprospiraceae bacterium]|nr:geranylgeranylglycerol-phosphate geranylgeranyltransferase [Saprospiraceae bacterium]
MIAYLRLIRLPNLLVVALVQWLLQYKVLLPFYDTVGLSPMLDDLDFGILVVVTVFLTMAGYIINDVYDYPIDRVNKPEKTIIGGKISLQAARFLFYGMAIMGASLAFYLALKIDRMQWLILYPIALGVLVAYARYFKKTTLVGNLIVSAFCAGVAIIVLFPEWENFAGETMTLEALRVVSVFSGYAFFAFFLTMYREVIKDMEDVEGDMQFGCRTLPIVAGISFSRKFAMVWMVALLIVIGFALPVMWKNALILFCWVLLTVFIPGIISIILLWNANSKKQFHLISQLVKIIMVTGTLSLVIVNL